LQKMNLTGDYHVKQNKPQLEDNLSHFPSYAESKS
jgi:hypothetical protein